MTQSDDRWLPAELEQFGEGLRDERPQASALELDRIKTRAMAQAARAASARAKGPFMKARVASILVVLGLVMGGTGGVLAATGGVPGSGGSSGSASNDQYCPPSSNDAGKPKHEGGGNKCGHHHHHHGDRYRRSHHR
jgi:hypothetical protein